MQAVSNSICAASGSQSLLRMRDVVSRFCVAETTIRRATARGSLLCLTLPSGHRRFREQDVLEWLGICHAEEKSHDGQIPIAAVLRVSSDGQNRRIGNSDKSSMEHQEQRVRDYINNRWGEKAKVTWYKSVGSGMNFERKVFLQLIKDILAGKFRGGFVVATDFTRICRFGVKLVEFLADQGGCQIVYTMDTTSDDNESLTDEILSILTHYTAKASGNKNKQINEVKLNSAQLKDAFFWYKSGGFSYKAISNRLAKDGRGKDEKGRTISRNVVMRRLQENWAALEKMYADGVEKNSFEMFVEKFVCKAKSESRLSRKKLLTDYAEWCRRENLPILSSIKISTFTTKLAWKKRLGQSGSVVFVGLSLKP